MGDHSSRAATDFTDVARMFLGDEMPRKPVWLRYVENGFGVAVTSFGVVGFSMADRMSISRGFARAMTVRANEAKMRHPTSDNEASR